MYPTVMPPKVSLIITSSCYEICTYSKCDQQLDCLHLIGYKVQVTSANNIHTLFSKQIMRILKL